MEHLYDGNTIKSYIVYFKKKKKESWINFTFLLANQLFMMWVSVSEPDSQIIVSEFDSKQVSYISGSVNDKNYWLLARVHVYFSYFHIF